MRHFGRFVQRQCLRQLVLHPERAERGGGYLLACTHISHVEPMILNGVVDRPISWMARIEFHRVPILATVLRHCNVFFVNRQGVPVSAIRAAITRAQSGEVVGIFPEGGCRKGTALAIRGAQIKQGICTIALRAQVPVLPVVVLGTHALNHIDPWLPGLHGKVWIAFGDAICPPDNPPRARRRAARRELAVQIEQEFIRTYHELLHRANLRDSMTP